MLVELLLLWEAFLHEPEMTARIVRRLGEKNKYIMYLMRKVAKREKGMKLKLMKFHGILHMMEDILLHGVPLEFDTGFNESHHKSMKKASKLTQRAHQTFNLQTGKRMVDFETIDFAMVEVEEGLAVWKYFDGLSEEEVVAPTKRKADALEGSTEQIEKEETQIEKEETQSVEEEDPVQSTPCDAMIRVYTSPTDGNPNYDMITASIHKDKTLLNVQLVGWLLDLQNLLISKALLPDRRLRIYTRIKRAHQSFRAHPNYRGLGPWRDWAWFDWGREKEILCHMWCFVKIPSMVGRKVYYGGVRLEEGVFAVVECSKEVPFEDGQPKTDVLFPLNKEVIWLDEEQVQHKKVFYLADTDAIVDPACVVPNIGGPSNQYFCVNSRTGWAGHFLRWLRTEVDDDMIIEEDVEEDQKEETADGQEEEPMADDLSKKSDATEDSWT